jgi:chemotaxis protein methyltransferase CheR
MTWTLPAFGELATQLSQYAGFAFPVSHRRYAEAGMQRAMLAAGEHTPAAYARRVAREPSLLAGLLAEVTVGETYFFRDPLQFATLAEHVVPELLGRTPASALRFWSAGCATGEEAYSLAILAEECGASHLVQIVGTDVGSAALAVAERGRYGARSFREGIDARRDRCFAPAGKFWSIDERFRRRVTFAVNNLNADGPDALLDARPFDLILCRNVLIYFDPGAVAHAVQRLVDRLAPGGWLFTSPTDPAIPETTGVTIVMTPAGIAYRRASAVEATPRTIVRPRPRSAKPAERSVRHEPASPPVAAVTVDSDALERHVVEALQFLDAGQPAEALVAARRARYLDRSSPVACLALGRALRLCGRPAAAQRELRRSRKLLAGQTGGTTFSEGGGISVETLDAVLEAELELLARAEVAS